MITINEVKERIKHIENISNDDEAAHNREDRLWEEVLRTIAAMGGHQGELAEEALKTTKIHFRRWAG